MSHEIKSTVSKTAFKEQILAMTRPPKKPYFGLQDKKMSRYITLLRMELSPLRAHKFKYKFSDTQDPFCSVCESVEDTEHFLLHCRSYRLSRVDLTQSVSSIFRNFATLPRKSKVRLLLYGDEKLKLEQNKMILEQVGKYISKSKRLDTY